MKSPYQLDNKQINMLSKNREYMRGLTNGRVPLEVRKKIITQKGGFIAGLLPLAAKVLAPTILGSIAGKLLGNMAFKKSVLLPSEY